MLISDLCQVGSCVIGVTPLRLIVQDELGKLNGWLYVQFYKKRCSCLHSIALQKKQDTKFNEPFGSMFASFFFVLRY